MNEQRMSPSGVNTSGIDSILKMGSINNAAGALTEGALDVIEAELKAQDYQLDAASQFAETGATVIQSQLTEVCAQAAEQRGGDKDGALGEIGGGIFGLATGLGGGCMGLLSSGGDSDELKGLNDLETRLGNKSAHQEDQADVEMEVPSSEPQATNLSTEAQKLKSELTQPEPDFRNFRKASPKVQDAVLNSLADMKESEKSSLRSSLGKAQAKARNASRESSARKWQFAGSLFQMTAQPSMSIGQAIGQFNGLGDHMAATTYGGCAQVDETVGSQYTQAASSKANDADSNLRAALQVAQGIRG